MAFRKGAARYRNPQTPPLPYQWSPESRSKKSGNWGKQTGSRNTVDENERYSQSNAYNSLQCKPPSQSSQRNCPTADKPTKISATKSPQCHTTKPPGHTPITSSPQYSQPATPQYSQPVTPHTHTRPKN
ncbi:hypothetical protein CAEBREN_32400 [Caenorhabditis brenneri]|uniref:Uncharacterized protein n=1 Tax=Caenorhabditis brenneri TaxID=135651 RepID=G0NHP9_CAEBE|nr:hypothetical protein CAEBREN_32400 [Caenorhabditis brenneri]